MSNPKESIAEWLRTKSAPSPTEFFEAFLRNGVFLNEESTFWDFKDKFPFSYSDDYFYGICRLICGFYNTLGGAIVFGVNDETRLPSKSKVIPNTDRLKESLIDLCGHTPDFVVESYQIEGEKIHLLLVCPRENGARIIKFHKSTAKYRAETVWVIPIRIDQNS
jgi:predicted HTH transcriptional regulator